MDSMSFDPMAMYGMGGPAPAGPMMGGELFPVPSLWLWTAESCRYARSAQLLPHSSVRLLPGHDGLDVHGTDAKYAVS